jgi:hypothetical protein
MILSIQLVLTFSLFAEGIPALGGASSALLNTDNDPT